MSTRLSRIIRSGFERSPKDNIERFRTRFRQMFRKNSLPRKYQAEAVNHVLPAIWQLPIFRKLILHRIDSLHRPWRLLGNTDETGYVKSALVQQTTMPVVEQEWDWDTQISLSPLPPDGQVLVCKIPTTEQHWTALKQLRLRCPCPVLSLHELVLPFTTIQLLQSTLDYNEGTLETIVPYYTGERFFGGLDALSTMYSLAGKRVIEFGPLEGAQTAGLLKLGAQSVTCIEARPENFIKTSLAQYAFGWSQVQLVMDDFHDVHAHKYGTFDLAFAHGVYYHSIAPFLFFENLLSLADDIFVGGFCATPTGPAGKYEVLTYEGEQYRVKRYKELIGAFTAGVNDIGYYFEANDLMEFFRRRGRDVRIVADYPCDYATGRYLRFLARQR